MLLRNGEKRMRSGRWAAGIGITAAVFGTLSLVSWSTARATGPFTLGTAVALPAPAGRRRAVGLDFGGMNFRTSYSDDGGANWTVSTTTGSPVVTSAPSTTELAEQDRPWLATGPNDRAYLLFHNLASGTANHNMY